MKKILLSCVTCLLALGLVTACDETDEPEDKGSETPDTGETIPSGDGGDSGTGTGDGGDTSGTLPGGGDEEGAGTTLQYVEVQELVSGESYYFGYPNGEDYYFFNGSLYYTSALYCSENVEEALMVTVTGDDTDGWTLTYTGTDDEEYTIYCYMYNDSSVDITAVKTSELEEALKDNETDQKTNATATFTWDSEHAGLTVTLGETACYVSTYAQFKEISLSKGSFEYAASHFYKAVEVPNPTAVTVSAEETSVKVGGSLQLTATVEPEGAYADMTWSSSDNSVAIVSDTGLVKGISEAEEVTITATSTVNPNATGSITIAVTEADVGDKFEVDVTAQYIIDYFERDDSSDTDEDAIATGESGKYAMGSGSGNTANNAEKYGFDQIGGTKMNFGAFTIDWVKGATGNGVKLWTGNQIRIYNASGLTITPNEDYEITAFSMTETNNQLTSTSDEGVTTCKFTLTTGKDDAASTLTFGTDFTADNSSNLLSLVKTPLSDLTVMRNVSGTPYITSISITCTKTSA